MSRRIKKAVIIGAGPAGLTAAYELLKQSEEYEVVILEQDGCVGGISWTVNCSGNRMDMGGHRFFSKNAHINEWWESILPLQGAPAWDDKRNNRQARWSVDGPDPDREDKVMLLRKRVSHIYYNGSFFDYPVKLNFHTIRSMGVPGALCAGGSFLKTRFYKLPETSLENFYVNRFGRKLYEMFFESYTQKLWGRHPREISADWGVQRVKGLSAAEVLRDSLGKLFHMKGKEQEDSGMRRIDRISCVSGGERYSMQADAVFSTMPVQNLLRCMNGVPRELREIGEGPPYREFITVGVQVERKYVRRIRGKHGRLCNMPDCWIYVQDPGIQMGRIQIFNNWSPYMVQRPEETVWMGLEYLCGKGGADWNRTGLCSLFQN